MWFSTIFGLAVVSYCLVQEASCDENNFFLKASKSVPRIGRSNRNNNNNGDFEKFFLKASKSVPRIGRRNENQYSKEMAPEELESMGKTFKYPTWSEIADRYEYEPELFNSAELLEKLEKELGDDPSVYEWDKVRVKRKIPERFLINNS